MVILFVNSQNILKLCILCVCVCVDREEVRGLCGGDTIFFLK